MKDRNAITPVLMYFFKRLEKRTNEIQRAFDAESLANQDPEFDEISVFFRQIMTQNIFIHTVGQNGKRESTILSKAIFSINKVVRIYYSTSFDEENGGFIRIQPDLKQQLIVVERMHGQRASPEFIYGSRDQNHIIRFMIRWLMRRIDWDKTKLANLELYKRYIDELEQAARLKIENAIIQKELDQAKRAVDARKVR
ncbi:MAG: hypothetical protein ISEC1_P0910 [Thiomicrorhabdus sp.]|nr:MAG: hypothetical protein ISEC1_P0910 [Thiomicrorhabdus sp.]